MPALAAGDRAVFLGLPKSGKTNLMAALALAGAGRPIASFVVFDSKQHRDEWQALAGVLDADVTADPEQLRRDPRVMFLVNQLALEDRAGWSRPGSVGYSWTLALRYTYERGHTLAIFDEMLQTLPATAPHPQARQILTQGRAHGVSTWAATQYPKWIDTLALRIAEHLFAFRIQAADVRREIEKARGISADVLAELPAYHFAYHREGAPSWTVCTPAPNVMRRVSDRPTQYHAPAV